MLVFAIKLVKLLKPIARGKNAEDINFVFPSCNPPAPPGLRKARPGRQLVLKWHQQQCSALQVWVSTHTKRQRKAAKGGVEEVARGIPSQEAMFPTSRRGHITDHLESVFFPLKHNLCAVQFTSKSHFLLLSWKYVFSLDILISSCWRVSSRIRKKEAELE